MRNVRASSWPIELIEQKSCFAITSHIRPDGDSLGSSLGLYWLLRALDKEVEVIMRDEVPRAYQKLPGTREVRVTPAVDRPFDAVFVIECSDITRPGLIDLEKQFVVKVREYRKRNKRGPPPPPGKERPTGIGAGLQDLETIRERYFALSLKCCGTQERNVRCPGKRFSDSFLGVTSCCGAAVRSDT